MYMLYEFKSIQNRVTFVRMCQSQVEQEPFY